MTRSTPRARRRDAGMTIVELMISLGVLAIASLSLVNAFSTSTAASVLSDRKLQVQADLQSTYENVADVAYEQLLSWNGTVTKFAGHQVTVSATLVAVGLIELEFVATDTASGQVVGRMATFRSGEF